MYGTIKEDTAIIPQRGLGPRPSECACATVNVGRMPPHPQPLSRERRGERIST
jgi:hypothetical protein